MFLGEYKHQTDEKFRLRMPSAFKKVLGASYMITKGTNGCLFVFSENSKKELFEDKLKNASLFDANLKKPLRLLFSSAFMVEEDNQGRFLLPKALREFAALQKNVVFVGVGSHIEIWDERLWQEYQQNETNFDKLLAGLAEYGI
jgi:MraZ protein